MQNRSLNHLFTCVCITLVCCATTASAQNALTRQEIKEGWKLLFDGKSLKGWHNFLSNGIGSAWSVQDGAIHLDKTVKKDGGDIVTDGEYENFELALEWKIAPCGNSGIMFNVVESAEYKYVWQTGPEMQVLDNACHPDAKIEKHRAGNLYDLIASPTESVKAANEWNAVKIISNKGHLEFWLNSVKQVETTMYTPEWEAMIKNSKFKDMPGFGKFKKGKISLQDHGDLVWYRNIKIRELR